MNHLLEVAIVTIPLALILWIAIRKIQSLNGIRGAMKTPLISAEIEATQTTEYHAKTVVSAMQGRNVSLGNIAAYGDKGQTLVTNISATEDITIGDITSGNSPK